MRIRLNKVAIEGDRLGRKGEEKDKKICFFVFLDGRCFWFLQDPCWKDLNSHNTQRIGYETDMAEKYGLKEKSTRVQHFILPFQQEKNRIGMIMVAILWAKIILEE